MWIYTTSAFRERRSHRSAPASRTCSILPGDPWQGRMGWSLPGGQEPTVGIHLLCLLGKLGQEMLLLLAVGVKPFGFTLAGGLAWAQWGPGPAAGSSHPRSCSPCSSPWFLCFCVGETHGVCGLLMGSGLGSGTQCCNWSWRTALFPEAADEDLQ